jgi:hypothetical protein
MDLRHEAAAIGPDPRRQANLPQRPVTRQRLAEHTVAEEVEAPVIELCVRDAELEHVPGDVEVGVVDPVGLAHAGQRVGEPAPEARHVLEPAGDVAPQRGQRGPRPPGCNPERGAPGHVHVGVGGLHAQERAVHR